MFLPFGSCEYWGSKHPGTSLFATYVVVSLGIVGSHRGAFSSKIQEALAQLHKAKNIYALEATEVRKGTSGRGGRGRDPDSQRLNRSKVHDIFA